MKIEIGNCFLPSKIIFILLLSIFQPSSFSMVINLEIYNPEFASFDRQQLREFAIGLRVQGLRGHLLDGQDLRFLQGVEGIPRRFEEEICRDAEDSGAPLFECEKINYSLRQSNIRLGKPLTIWPANSEKTGLKNSADTESETLSIPPLLKEILLICFNFDPELYSFHKNFSEKDVNFENFEVQGISKKETHFNLNFETINSTCFPKQLDSLEHFFP